MLTLLNAINDFHRHCKFEKNLSQKTLKAYEIDLRQFHQFLLRRKCSIEILAVGKNELRAYLEEISTLKPKSIKRKIATIKAMFNYLEFEDCIPINPFRKMKIKIKEPKVLPKALALNEIQAIFKNAYQERKNAKKLSSYRKRETLRNIAVVELLFATGARVSEIANLKDEHVELVTGTVVLKGKGDKERAIQICNKDTLNILIAYRKAFHKKIHKAKNYFLINRLGSRLSEQSIRTIIRDTAKNAKIPKHVTPHCFRHSFGTLLLENDVDIKYIQLLLGHSSIVTTQIYTHVNQEKQRQILLAKHPRRLLSLSHS